MTTLANPAQAPAEDPDEELVRFGTAVRDRRKMLGLTQADLATLIGLTRTSVANIEAGRQQPPYLTVRALAAALHMTMAELAGEEPAARVPTVGVVSRVWCSWCGDLGERGSPPADRVRMALHVRSHMDGS